MIKNYVNHETSNPIATNIWENEEGAEASPK